MSRKLLGIFGVLLLTLSLNGQKFGKVGKELFANKTCTIDSSAVAAYLYAGCEVSYQFNRNTELILDYHYRIQVYKKDGEEYGSFSIPLYKDGSKKEIIEGLKGFTFNMEGDEIIKQKLDKQNIYREKTADNWVRVKFEMPDVKPGTIIDVRYRIRSPYIYTIPKWNFQHYIPVMHSQLELIVPSYFGLTPIATGAIIPIRRKEKHSIGDKHESRTFQLVVYDVEALVEDDYVLNDNDYRSGIKYEILSVEYPGSTRKEFSKDWVTIGNNLLKLSLNGPLKSKKSVSSLKPIVEEAKLLPKPKRIFFLYDYVRSTYAWNGNYGSQPRNGLGELISSKKGNIAEINLLLLNLLRKAEIEAHPYATKTRHRGLLNYAYPSVSELNYLLAYVEIDGKEMFLDATDKHVPLGMLPTRAINIGGVLLKKNQSEVKSIQNTNKLKERTVLKYRLDLDELTLIGEGQSKRIGYSAVKYRKELEKLDDDDQQDVEETRDEDEEEEDEQKEDRQIVHEIRNEKDVNKPILILYEETESSCLREIGDEIFIDADFGKGLSKNPFTEKEREHPVFFNYLIDINRVFELEIPEEYELKKLPEDGYYQTTDKKITFRYNAKQVGNKIYITYIFKTTNDIILPLEYHGLKEIYEKVMLKNEEKIILDKA